MNLAVIVVFHRKKSEEATLIDLLSTRTELSVKEAEDKDEITPGTLYVAPADYHLLIEKNKTLSLDFSEKVNYSRPSIDVSIESACEVFGASLGCILLSGANADGVAGLAMAKRAGGLIVVQDPAFAEFPVMPLHAVAHVSVDLLINENNLGLLTDLLS
jgi:two-component system, chemotaxis family, protein-glutamate methylesterase/glutaminase